MKRAAAIVAASMGALAACTGQTGSLLVEVVTAPGSTIREQCQRARLTLTLPRTVVEDDDPSDGFSLSIDVAAGGQVGEVYLECFDATGALTGVGRSPPIPIAAISATIRIYVAPPMSVAQAPVALDPPRTRVGTGLLPYGVVLVGGERAGGVLSDDVLIYDAYDHSLAPGDSLPAPRAGVSVGVGLSGYAYLFGGSDEAGQATGTLWRFDTQISPAGAFIELEGDPALARSDAPVAPTGSERFLVAGTPPAIVDGFSTEVRAIATLASLGGTLSSVEDTVVAEPAVYTVAIGTGAGTTGVVRYTGGFFTELPGASDALRVGHGSVPTPSDEVVAVAGEVAGDLVSSAIRVNPRSGEVESIPDVLARPRRDAAIATNGIELIVAGGVDADGSLVDDVEIFDLAGLTPIATLPLVVPRRGAVAQPLANDLILIIGGRDAAGAPIGTIEIFSPPLPPR